MAKRFTDTDKWNDEWFMDLEPALKCFWIYLCDKCDHAGFWKVNFKQATFSIGTIIDKQSALRAYGDRIKVVSSEKWFIQKFISFQYPTGLSDANKAHVGVIKALNLNNIDSSPFKAPLKLLPSPYQGPLREAKDKDKEKDITSPSSFSSNTEELVNTKSPKKNLSEKESQEILKPDHLIQAWNDLLIGKGKLSYCHGLSGNDLKELLTTLAYPEFANFETWKKIFKSVGSSKFLNGTNGTFSATLNWLVKHDNALKVLNGQYNGVENGSKSAQKQFLQGTPENRTGNPYLERLNELEGA